MLSSHDVFHYNAQPSRADISTVITKKMKQPSWLIDLGDSHDFQDKIWLWVISHADVHFHATTNVSAVLDASKR